MLKRLLSLFIFATVLINSVKADEGMWLPFLLNDYNYETMKKMGLKLSPEALYDVNQSSLKDAIVSFGGFCTGEIISKEGLLLTNHHCGYGAIQSHSTVDHDYLTDGFWAMDKSQELPVEGLFVRFLVKIEDVTDSILYEVDYKMEEATRTKLVRERIKKFTKKAGEGNHYTISIKPFFEGNRYYMYVFETYNDVRLVGAPPSSVGKYGGDTDNWKWPRHTGDFSMFRVYTDKDGKPSEYNEDNIPLKPKHHLPISLKGIEEGDFAMIFGYPGRTQRYKTSFGIQQDLEVVNPTRIQLRDKRLKVLKKQMNASDEVRIKYASKYAGIANYYKYFIGQNEGLRKLNTIEKKQEGEAIFNDWANQDALLKDMYGNVLKDLEEVYKLREERVKLLYYFIESAYASDLISFIENTYPLIKRVGKHLNNEELIEIQTQLLQMAEKHFKDYDEATDSKVFASLLSMLYKDVPHEFHPTEFKSVIESCKGDFDRYAYGIYKTSVFANKAKFIEFVEEIEDFQVEKDRGIILYNSIDTKFREIRNSYFEIAGDLSRNKRLYLGGLMEMKADEHFYPDANSTMRTTFGKVEAYEPGDGIEYNYFTTMIGLMEKKNNDDPEFVVPDKLTELYNNKDYGQYGTEDSNLIVCFITNNDITGGNSGSPVINGKGELIGCAFDGNWEAMTGDLVFDPNLKRCINADIRYILFIIDKYAGAGHLVDEMTIVR